MSAHFLAGDGARIAYRVLGRGVPLLCLPGLTRSMSDFDYLLARGLGCQVILMDYRGRGDSDWTGAASYTVPQEAQDALGLLDHLGIERAAILGTSRGGLIGMLVAAMAGARLIGLCLNDIGPEIHRPGLERIFDYVGRNPAAQSHADMATRLERGNPGFANVPPGRWLEEAQRHFRARAGGGLEIRYDPELRAAFLAGFQGPPVDLWPLFDALAGKPLALIRGANSDLLTQDCADRMRERRGDMHFGLVPDRGHVPFLDEPESLGVIAGFLSDCAGVAHG